jgi:VanZ family protein
MPARRRVAKRPSRNWTGISRARARSPIGTGAESPSLDSGLGLIDTIGRKLIHVAEYALLAFLWWRALVTVTSPGRAALFAFLLSSGYAVTDEYHQTFVEGRHGSPVDWAIDSAGAALAALKLRSVRVRDRTAA